MCYVVHCFSSTVDCICLLYKWIKTVGWWSVTGYSHYSFSFAPITISCHYRLSSDIELLIGACIIDTVVLSYNVMLSSALILRHIFIFFHVIDYLFSLLLP